jgi:hypothetical protein
MLSSHTVPPLRTGVGPGGWGLRIFSSLNDSFGREHTTDGETVWSAIGCGH